MVNKYKADHNNVQIERGPWRKYNPYKPDVPDDNKKSGGPSKIESLDDLFAEEPQEEEKVTDTMLVAEESSTDDLIDIQKELEAKFDELFGPLDD